MNPIKSTAYGKVILFGEHAVVYNRPAIAVPVTNIQATVTLKTDEADPSFRILAPDINKEYLLNQAPPNDPLAAITHNTLTYLSQSIPVGVTLKIESSIPVGRGLGSGAAVSTAIVRALGEFFDHTPIPADISTLVYEVEKLYHGTPSGIDNTVIAFEQPVYFVKGMQIQRLRVSKPLTLVIGDTGVISSTHKVVADLRLRWQENRELYEGYFDEIGVIVRQARVAIEHNAITVSALGKLMNENHELLKTIGLSSPELDRLVKVAIQAGALGAKLSGAGWGGNMIALTTAETAPFVAQALIDAKANGVIVTEVI